MHGFDRSLELRAAAVAVGGRISRSAFRLDEPGILLVSDGTLDPSECAATFRGLGYGVRSLDGHADVERGLLPAKPNLVILISAKPLQLLTVVMAEVGPRRDVAFFVITDDRSERTLAEALDRGADDFLTMPLRSIELNARSRRALRRIASELTAGRPFADGVNVNPDLGLVEVRGQVVQLPRKEKALIQLLARRAGAVVTHEEIMREIWGDQHLGDLHYMRVLVKKLRDKIERNPASPRVIVTDTGVGYRLALHEAASHF